MPREPRFRLHITYKSGRVFTVDVTKYNITWNNAEDAVVKYEWTYVDGYKGQRPVFTGMANIESVWVETL